MAKLPAPITFDWDRGNIEKNWKRHNVHYRESEEAFFNKPLRIFPDKKHSKKERRILGLGVTNTNRKLTIIFTIREKTIRIISARDMNKKERTTYDR